MNVSKHLKNEATVSSKSGGSKVLIWLQGEEFIPVYKVSLALVSQEVPLGLRNDRAWIPKIWEFPCCTVNIKNIVKEGKKQRRKRCRKGQRGGKRREERGQQR